MLLDKVVKVPEALLISDELIVETLMVVESCVMILALSKIILDAFKVVPLKVDTLRVDILAVPDKLMLDTASLDKFV